MKKRIRIYKILSFIFMAVAITSFYFGYKQVKAPILLALAFHDVDDNGKNTFSISEPKFFALIQQFKDYEYDAISPEDFEALFHNNGDFTGRKFIVTFDDGKSNNVPIIKKLKTEFGITSTIFLVLDDIGKPDFMDLSAILELKNQYGCNIGLHGQRHLDITKIHESNDNLAAELDTAQSLLSSLISTEVTWYSYPFGATNAATTEILQNSKLNFAFNVEGGNIQDFSNNLFINRLMYTENAEENKMPNPYNWLPPYTVSKGALIVTLAILVGFLSLNLYLKAFMFAKSLKK